MLRHFTDVIYQDGRIDVLAILFQRQMKMWSSTATTVACQGDDGAGMDVGAFGDEDLGEVAIADGEVAVTEGDIEA